MMEVNVLRFIHIIIMITKAEYILIISVIFLLFIARIVFGRIKNFEDKTEKIFSNNLLESIEKQTSYHDKLVPQKCRLHSILKILEDFDSKFSGELWEALKVPIVNKYLINKARKWVHHKWWIKRNFSARCFILVTLKEDEQNVISLLKDSISLVRISATFSAIKIETIPLLQTLMQTMSKEPERGRYAYRDAILLKARSSVFSWIREQLKLEKDPKLRFIYLDILAAKFDSYLLDYIEQDLKSSDEDLRLKAVKIVLAFPEAKTEKMIMPYLSDSYYLVRAEIINHLPKLLKERALPFLEKALFDSEWWVKLQASLALKQLGQSGLDILNKTKENKDLTEVIDYVQSLP